MSYAPHIPEDVHQELLNWARWCWAGPWPHPLPATECGSLEASYRAPPEWGEDEEDERRTPTIRPNERNARLVQGVWEHLPPEQRAVLKAEYPAAWAVQRRQDVGREAAARSLGMNVEAYERFLGAAVRRVGAAFEVSL